MSNIVEAKYRVVHERSLPVIASEILYIESQVAKTALEGAIQIGMKLKEAKEKVEHGQWENWCSENLNYSKSKTEKLMKIAAEYGDENSPYAKTYMCTDLSISKALKLLQVPENEVEKFAEENKVQDMTVKELEEEIKALKKKREDERSALKSEIGRLERGQEEAERERQALERQLDDLKAQVPDEEVFSRKIAELENQLEAAAKKEGKLKEKLKKEKTAKDEEIQKALDAELQKMREGVQAEVSDKLDSAAEENDRLRSQVKNLEAKVANVSNESLILFKLKVDQLQNVFAESIETADSAPDPGKLRGALRQIMQTMMKQL